jgi:hypothetical protein
VDILSYVRRGGVIPPLLLGNRKKLRGASLSASWLRADTQVRPDKKYPVDGDVG